MSELLVTCLLCGRGGFSARGLRAHWCPEKAGHAFRDGREFRTSKKSAPLTKDEWDHALFIAKHGPWAVDVCGAICQCSNSRDQLEKVRTMPSGHLQKVLNDQCTSKTVRKAAEVRLRRLMKEAA
jgi:hypothetical protein